MAWSSWWAWVVLWWRSTGARHLPRSGDVWRSGDGTTEVRVIRPAVIQFRAYVSPGFYVTVARGSEVQGGDMPHAALVGLVGGYRLVRRGEG